jgi:hypothetical protein
MGKSNNHSVANYSRVRRWYLWSLTGTPRTFNAIAFYLHITGMTTSCEKS